MIEKYLDKLEYNKILSNLANMCITDYGKTYAKNLQPSNNRDTVIYLLNQTDEAISFIIKNGAPPISYIGNIEYFINILNTSGTLPFKGLLEIANVLQISSNLKNAFFKEDYNFPNLENLFSKLYTNPSIEKTITTSIIDEFTIDDKASTELYNIRRKQHSIEENIKNKLNDFIHSSTYSKYIQENVITIRNERYVIPIKEEYRSNVKGFVHDISSSGSTVFIEPMIIFQLNNDLSTLKAEETIEINKILSRLSFLLFPIVSELKNNVEIIGEIDLIFAKANYSNSIDAVMPEICTEKVIKLISARHPFIDKNTVVPIDIELGFNFNSLVITGPNTGGKTVALKTVGLLTLMACSGFFIPANEHSKIHVFDNVFADIGDEQSIQESLSTFSAHMKHIIYFLQNVTNNSLVLLDELGSGTDPIEGSSLAISILENLYEKGALTIATTHYPEIKKYALVTDGFENASSDFDIENLKPTYKLLIGVPGKSNAFSISKKLGLDQSIIDRASSFITSEQINIEELLKNIYDNKLEIENEKEQIKKNSSQIELLRKSLEENNSKIKSKEVSIIENAKIEARKILLDAKNEASLAISEVNKIYDNIDSESIKAIEKIRNNLNNSIKDTVTVSNSQSNTESNLTKQDMKIGMNVFITTINQYGTISSIPNKSNQVQVQVGSTKLMVPISNIMKSDNNIITESKSTTSYKTNKTKTASTEINVIGYNVEEAIYVIDKYLDDCSLAKLSTVRIVHGKGTGTLRNGIHNYLKRNSHVKSFRNGTFGEGEMGVTIVELKIE